MKKRVAFAVAVAGLAGAWYAFRPEKLFTSEKVNETFPAAAASAASPAPVALRAGNFHGVAHESQGTATIFQLPDGKRVVRLANFKTSNGPQLHLYLTSAADATDSDTIEKAEILDLGDLKGNEGDQNYDIPAGADLNKFKSATVWCARFGVNFATAPLSATSSTASSAPSSTLAKGTFHSVAHEGTGDATVYQLADGQRVLRLTNFTTSNGPQLRLYLVAADDATDNDVVKKAGFLDLGALKGNEGDQNYTVPAGADLGKYKAVTVWCARFGVNFTTAPLTRP
jgi:hypothetical protein